MIRYLCRGSWLKYHQLSVSALGNLVALLMLINMMSLSVSGVC
jgi:hypothetical protein